MFARVLVPLDGSKAALAALDYAEVIPSESVRLLSVVPVSGPLALPALLVARHDEWLATVVANITVNLDEAAATLSRQGRTIETRVVMGDPAERIVEAAADVDLIVMTTHGHGAGGRMMYGSVADRVVRHAPAPVLVVRGGEHPVPSAPVGRIVVPLDGSAVAEQALPVAISLADDLGVPIQLVRALDVDMLRETVRAGASAAAAYADSVETVRRAVVAYLDEQAKIVRGHDVMVGADVRDGPATAEILRYTRPGDLLVMTTHGRGGIRRWLLGSVAEKVVREASVPVLLMRARKAEGT